MSKRSLFLRYSLMLSLSFLISVSGAAAAEKYPLREIQLVIPNPPGGFVDSTVRLMVPLLTKNLGAPLVISNRTGAGGATGTQYLIKSKPDGYTIGAISSANTVLGPATITNLPFKYSDMDPLCKYASDSTVIFTRGDAPWKTLEDLVADAKKRPGLITYGTTTNSVSHFLIEGFLKAAGISMTHIPLKGADQTTIRVLGGNLDVGGSSITPIAGQIKAGTVRALFLATPERSSLFPQIPTLQEKGYRDPVVTLYTGFFAPLGLSPSIRQTLVKALEKTIKDPNLKKKIEDAGAVLEYLPGAAMAKEIEQDYNHIVKIVRIIAPSK